MTAGPTNDSWNQWFRLESESKHREQDREQRSRTYMSTRGMSTREGDWQTDRQEETDSKREGRWVTDDEQAWQTTMSDTQKWKEINSNSVLLVEERRVHGRQQEKAEQGVIEWETAKVKGEDCDWESTYLCSDQLSCCWVEQSCLFAFVQASHWCLLAPHLVPGRSLYP